MRKPVAVAAGVLVALGATAGTASAKTIHLFSKEQSQTLYDAQGKVVTDPNVEPTAGARFYATDLDYLGTHRRHSKKPIAFDHIGCTFVTVNPFSTICDAQIALPGGLIYADRSVAPIEAQANVFRITGGLGKYRKAKGGKVISRSVNENDADLTIRY
jgi:hypothetical protein